MTYHDEEAVLATILADCLAINAFWLPICAGEFRGSHFMVLVSSDTWGVESAISVENCGDVSKFDPRNTGSRCSDAGDDLDLSREFRAAMHTAELGASNPWLRRRDPDKHSRTTTAQSDSGNCDAHLCDGLVLLCDPPTPLQNPDQCQ